MQAGLIWRRPPDGVRNADVEPRKDLMHVTSRRKLRYLMSGALAVLTAFAATASPQDATAPPPTFEAAFAAAGWSPTPEEIDEALEKWLREYVTYIITDEERRIFEALPTREQKLAFTERFWDIRDPTPGTALNEYRREHMERWATANRRFSAGRPGWATDRGRVYIILGTPNNLQRNPMGRGPMERASEVWTYNLADNPALAGVLDLSFVDFKGTGEYELVSNLDESAPIATAQFGYTNNPLDAMALRRHADSIYDERFLGYRWTDPSAVASEFLEFQQNLREVLRIPEIYKERLASLRTASVESEVVFDAVPIGRALDTYEAVGGNVALQVTLALESDELTAAPYGDAFHYSADIYVALEKDGATVDSDERRLNFSLTEQERGAIGDKQILHSAQLLAPPGDYDLVIMVRDNAADRIGRRLEPVTLPALTFEGLRTSTLTLASHIEPATVAPDSPPREFQLGDTRVIPNVNRTYYPDQLLLLYVQAYGLTLDPRTGANKVTLKGAILRDGQVVRTFDEQHPYPAPLTRQSFSMGVPLSSYRPGVYQVRLEVVDDLAGSQVAVTGDFAVLPPQPPGTGTSR